MTTDIIFFQIFANDPWRVKFFSILEKRMICFLCIAFLYILHRGL